jgi:hypothetical protein
MCRYVCICLGFLLLNNKLFTMKRFNYVPPNQFAAFNPETGSQQFTYSPSPPYSPPIIQDEIIYNDNDDYVMQANHQSPEWNNNNNDTQSLPSSTVNPFPDDDDEQMMLHDNSQSTVVLVVDNDHPFQGTIIISTSQQHAAVSFPGFKQMYTIAFHPVNQTTYIATNLGLLHIDKNCIQIFHIFKSIQCMYKIVYF